MEWTESSKHPECSKCLEMGNQFKSIICCGRGELIQTKRLYLNMRRGISFKMLLFQEVDLEDYVSRPEKISCADIAAICQEAGMSLGER